MNYGLFANITALTHVAILIAVVFGLLLSFRYKRFRPWEAGALVLIVILWSYYGNCPLTILEQRFRDLAGQTGVNLTSIGFLPYYMHKLFDVSLASKTVQHSTFFTGGILFTASIEWFTPFFHMEIFKLRKFLRKNFSTKRLKTRRA